MWVDRAAGKSPNLVLSCESYLVGDPKTCIEKNQKYSNFLHVSFALLLCSGWKVLGVIAFWNILYNIIILFFLLAGLPFAILTSRHTPFKRGLFCKDESIQYPYKADTISYELLAGIIIPFDVIVVSLHLIFFHYIVF